ncbi:MAG: sigma-70 family RNA polymerase sigma factor [bacterium]
MSGEIDFQKVYEEYQPKIARYLSRLTGRDEAEDMAQDVFEKVHLGLAGFEGRSKLSTWIYRIATNTALDKLRSRSFIRLTDIKPLEENQNIEDRNVWTGQTRTPVDQELISREMNSCIRGYVEKLPTDYKTVIILSEIEGFRNTEIAEILEASLETVKIRLHRARARLKKELEAHCTFYQNERNVLACDIKTALEKPEKSD